MVAPFVYHARVAEWLTTALLPNQNTANSLESMIVSVSNTETPSRMEDQSAEMPHASAASKIWVVPAEDTDEVQSCPQRCGNESQMLHEGKSGQVSSVDEPERRGYEAKLLQKNRLKKIHNWISRKCLPRKLSFPLGPLKRTTSAPTPEELGQRQKCKLFSGRSLSIDSAKEKAPVAKPNMKSDSSEGVYFSVFSMQAARSPPKCSPVTHSADFSMLPRRKESVSLDACRMVTDDRTQPKQKNRVVAVVMVTIVLVALLAGRMFAVLATLAFCVACSTLSITSQSKVPSTEDIDRIKKLEMQLNDDSRSRLMVHGLLQPIRSPTITNILKHSSVSDLKTKAVLEGFLLR